MLQVDCKVLKRFCFLLGFLRSRLLGSIPEGPPGGSQHPTLPPPSPVLPSSVSSFVPNSMMLCEPEEPWCSCEVSMTNSGKARRAFLTSTKPLCHRIVQVEPKFHLGIRKGCFYFFQKEKLGRRKRMEGTELTQFTSVIDGILRCSFMPLLIGSLPYQYTLFFQKLFYFRRLFLNIQSVFHVQTYCCGGPRDSDTLAPPVVV